MRPSRKVELLEQIGATLQSRMSYDDIDIYMKASGIHGAPRRHSYDSKRVYAKDLLFDASDEKLLEIARNLEIIDGLSIDENSIRASNSRF